MFDTLGGLMVYYLLKKKGIIEKEGVLMAYTGNDRQFIIPDNVRKIGETAFNNCSSLEQIIISSNVTEIEKKAFRGCSALEKIYAPKNLDLSGTGYPEDCEIIRY